MAVTCGQPTSVHEREPMFVTRTPLMFTPVIGLTQLGRPTRRFLPSHRGVASVSSPREVTGAVGGLLVADPPHPASNPTTTINNVRATVVAYGAPSPGFR
jgi:hypothetical protein